ncbi:MAG TPA: hypothetical protein VF983_08995 [Streptosporangiaceae bacterium]
MLSPRIGLDHREGQRDGPAPVDVCRDLGQVVAGRDDQRLVDGAGRRERLQCDLDVYREAGGTAFVWLEAVAETAVVVAVAAQRVDDPGGLRSFEAGSEQPALKKPALAQNEVPRRSELVIHARQARSH